MVSEYSSNDAQNIVSEAAVSYESIPQRYIQLTAILGGEHTLSKQIHNEMDLIHLSRTGLPRKTIDILAQHLGITMDKLSRLLHISLRTIQRKSANDPLSVHVSEQLLAIAEVIRRGQEVLGHGEQLGIWLHTELVALDHKTPIDLMDTTFGTHMLLKLLGRIEHGIY